MITSSSENFSWDYNPPKKLQTTLLLNSPHTLQDLSNNSYRQSDSFSRKFPAIVTPRDCTRTNSPVQMPSPIFSDEDSDMIRPLYEQLILIRDRHNTLKTYINSVRAQLQQSFNLGIAELQGKRNTLITQVDLFYDEAFNKLCFAHKEKEIKIQVKDAEVENSLEEIEGIINKIEFCGAENEKTVREIENTLKIWVSENDVNGEWATLEIPAFDFAVVPAKSKNAGFSEDTLENSAKHGTRCSSKKHRIHRHEHRSNSRKSPYQEMLKKNDEMFERISRIEQAISHKMRPPKPKPKKNKKFDSFELTCPMSPISISTLYSDDSEVAVTEKNRLKVYIPQGYPSFTCFYLVKVDPEITVGQVLDKLTSHMGMSQGRYCLKQGATQGKVLETGKKAAGFAKTKLFLDKSD